jgi:PPOX class probable FMN-dependent enzyme
MGQPTERALAKEVDEIDDICRAFIAKAPFIIIGTSDGDGGFDLSPKGDPAGFVQVLDNKHLAIPDRLGNRRIDTFANLLKNPKIGLIFLIPGNNDTLRISGEARIVRDEAVREKMAVRGKLPDFAIIVYVERVLLHCPKCMLRSNLWRPEAWPDKAGTPTLAEGLVKHAKLDISVNEMQELLETDRRERMY